MRIPNFCRGLLPAEIGLGVRQVSKTLHDQNLRFSHLYRGPDQKFDTLFMTVVADTVALNHFCLSIIYE